jgi:hypothetical protein
MKNIQKKMASKKFKMSITETVEYEEMLKRVTFGKVVEYLRKNQGKTFEDIVKFLGEEENTNCVKFLVDVWVNNWNSFFQSGGRIIENDSYYYCLSPQHPEARKRKPQIMLAL